MGYRAYLAKRLFGKRLEPADCEPGRIETSRIRNSRRALVQYFQMQLDAGQRLPCAGVQFPCNSRALPFQFSQ